MNIRKEKLTVFYELAMIMFAFLLIDIMLFAGLRSYFRAKFSDVKMQAIIDESSDWKEKTDDPCKWAVYGDPDAKDTYIKLFVSCPDSPSSTNTLDLRAIRGDSYDDLLSGYSKLHGIEGLIINGDGALTGWGKLINNSESRWACYVGVEEITDLRAKVSPKSEVHCLYANKKDINIIRNEISR